MNPARIAIIVVAIIAAVGLALLVHTAFKPKAPTVVERVDNSAGPPMTRVLAAKTDLAVGDRLSTDNMTWQPWPTATLNAAYITDGQAPAPKPQGAAGAVNAASTTVTDIATGGGPKMQSVVGDIVKDPIYAGEPITDRKIVRGGDSGYMAVRLPAGMRAMSLPVTVENGAGGFIQPGDRIDVVSSHPDTSKNSAGGMVTEVVLSNAKVLAVDQHTDTPKAGASMIGATLTLEVPVADVEAVARAKSQGGALVMALRSYADIGAGSRGPGPGAGQSVRIFRGSAPVEVVNSQ
jgi:pilus assembly protein CpaB